MSKALWGAPLSFIYGLAIGLRNKLYDWNILRSEEFDVPIVCVGNITVGGTGKTPVTEYLIEVLSKNRNVAVLSRGYKRKTKGFQLATVKSSYRAIGDEPKQIKLKFPEVPVAVCENRSEGIHRLMDIHPEVEVIILDDAFQHRRVEAWVNIVLMDYNNPIHKDHLLPWGRLRDSKSQMERANLVMVTKCPTEMTPLDTRIVKNCLGLYPYQSLYFTRMKQDPPTPLFPDIASGDVKLGRNIIVMSGIANPEAFAASLRKRYHIAGQLAFSDHHAYKMKDIVRLSEMLDESPEDTIIVTTEKDAVKLTNRKKIPRKIQERLYYVPIHLVFADDGERDFIHKLEKYVESNQKYSVLHPE